jgi:hypothetical protein
MLSIEHDRGAKPVILGMAGALMLVVLSYILRLDALMPVMGFCGLAWLFGCWEDDGWGKKHSLKPMLISLVMVIVVVGAAVGIRQFELTRPGVQEYIAWQNARTEVLDYGVPDYEKHEAEYNAAGIDSTAYKLMKRWTFQDNEKFTADTFKQIASFREKKTLNTSLVKSFIKSFAKGALKEGTFLCALAAAACWLLTGRHRLRNFLSLLVMCAMIGALEFYLYYAGRFMFNRVDVGI